MQPIKKTPRARLLARIHIAQDKLGMPDLPYRNMLERLTGKRSAANLTDEELHKVMSHFRSIGYTESHTAHPHTADTSKQLWLIGNYLGKMDLPNSYAEQIAINMHKTPLNECNSAQLRGIITALKKEHDRRAAA